MLIFLTDDWREGFALQRSLAEYQVEFETSETKAPRIHAEKAAEVAAFTARWGANELHQPVLKAERALFIPALKGFPGTYWAEWQQKLGAPAVLSLLESTENRTAHLSYVLAYCEPGKDPVTFEGGSTGTVAESVHKKGGTLIDQLYIPEYRLLNQVQTKTLTELEESEPELVRHAWGDAEKQFATWYLKEKK